MMTFLVLYTRSEACPSNIFNRGTDKNFCTILKASLKQERQVLMSAPYEKFFHRGQKHNFLYFIRGILDGGHMNCPDLNHEGNMPHGSTSLCTRSYKKIILTFSVHPNYYVLILYNVHIYVDINISK